MFYRVFKNSLYLLLLAVCNDEYVQSFNFSHCDLFPFVHLMYFKCAVFIWYMIVWNDYFSPAVDSLTSFGVLLLLSFICSLTFLVLLLNRRITKEFNTNFYFESQPGCVVLKGSCRWIWEGGVGGGLRRSWGVSRVQKSLRESRRREGFRVSGGLNGPDIWRASRFRTVWSFLGFAGFRQF